MKGIIKYRYPKVYPSHYRFLPVSDLLQVGTMKFIRLKKNEEKRKPTTTTSKIPLKCDRKLVFVFPTKAGKSNLPTFLQTVERRIFLPLFSTLSNVL